ncbi:T9SS type A sorting domain-containing protein [uncultured Tenacibaculum sp.]|uniref:T9SS type A sorting domain-containing protein n=1 Tax=uncultured Tenacibaculum sp. TaxID=174713 RepID=UPI002624BEC7|nr:T9SS type A sorting domain-containing protein [uncultured Tenacibaculum sp.]
MKRILLWLGLVLYTTLATSQEEINTTFATQMNTMFGQLNKNKVPNGILLDMAMEFTDVPAFNGTLSSQNYVSAKRYKEIYKTLLMGRINNVSFGFVSPDVLDQQWFNERSDSHIALAGLYFNYSRFVNNATTSGKLTYSNGKFYDKYINGVWQNPYQTLKTFAMTTPIQVYTGLQLKVKLPQSILYSNSASEIQKIEADFNDGNGYRILPFNQLISVNYSQEGNKIWKYKLTLANGQVLYSHSKIIIKEGINTPFAVDNLLHKGTANKNLCNLNSMNGVSFLDIQSSQSYSNKQGKARIFIDDAGNDCKITKPLIVVEGWDFSTLFSPETKYSSEDFQNFQSNIFNSQSSLKSLISGQSLGSNGDQEYDLIFVNWDNGMDYIQRNALVVEEVIKWVNQQKTLSGSTEKNVIIGQSMGGVVSRYALRDMEQRNLTHQVRLFVSQDSPQQGANIPLSIQYMYRNLRNQIVQAPLYTLIRITTLQDPAYKYFSLLDQPATKQMLINRATNRYGLDNSTHTSFYNELNAKGYPSQNGIRNIAISNGSECGSTQNFNAGDPLIQYNYNKSLSFLQDLASLIVLPIGGALAGALIDYDFFKVSLLGLIPGNSTFRVSLEDRALYSSGGRRIHHFRVSYTKKILWLFSVTTNIVNKNVNQPNSVNNHYDNYGGGFIDIGSYTGQLNVNGLTVKDKFTIVPSPSALGISANSNQDYLLPYVGANPPVAPLNSPFDNFITAFKATNNPNNNNERHLEFNARNGNWLAAEITGTNIITSDCSSFCSDVSIEGKDFICNSETYIFPGNATPSWSIAQGANLVNQSIVNNNITLSKKDNSSSGEVILKAIIGTPECGPQRTLTKKIWIGKPKAYVSQDANICAYVFLQEDEFKLPVSPGATRYEITSNNPNLLFFDTVVTPNTHINFMANRTGNFTATLTTYNDCGSTSTLIYVYAKDCSNLNGGGFAFRVYPNPTSKNSSITIENLASKNHLTTPKTNRIGKISSKSKKENSYKFELHNYQNVLVKKGIFDNEKLILDTANLKAGIYLLKIYMNKKTETHKLVIH